MTTEELLRSPCWIVDILPERVPAGSPGQYFAVERFFLTGPRRSVIRQKQRDLLLKLNCYRDFLVGEEMARNPAPELLEEALRERPLHILVDDALIAADPEDTYLTVYNPDETLLGLVRVLAAAEGLFVWRGQ